MSSIVYCDVFELRLCVHYM